MEDYGRIQKTGGGENGPLYNSPKGRFPQSQSWCDEVDCWEVQVMGVIGWGV